MTTVLRTSRNGLERPFYCCDLLGVGRFVFYDTRGQQILEWRWLSRYHTSGVRVWLNREGDWPIFVGTHCNVREIRETRLLCGCQFVVVMGILKDKDRGTGT